MDILLRLDKDYKFIKVTINDGVACVNTWRDVVIGIRPNHGVISHYLIVRAMILCVFEQVILQIAGLFTKKMQLEVYMFFIHK